MIKDKNINQAAQDPDQRCHECGRQKVKGYDLCPLHLPGMAEVSTQREYMYQFHRSEYMRNLAAQIPGFSKGASKFDLSEELGILRLQLQETLNKCENDLDFLRNNQKISNTVDQIRRTVESSLKLDHKLGNLLSKDEMIIVAQKLLQTIEENVTDPNTIQKIVTSFQTILTEQIASPGPRGPYDV